MQGSATATLFSPTLYKSYKNATLSVESHQGPIPVTILPVAQGASHDLLRRAKYAGLRYCRYERAVATDL